MQGAGTKLFKRNVTLPGKRGILFDALSFARTNGIVPSTCPFLIGFGSIYLEISWSTNGNQEIVISTINRNAPTTGEELHWNGKLGDNTAD